MPKKQGSKTVYSGQEATQLILMNSESEGEHIDLGEEFEQDSDLDSDWEAEDEDLESTDEEVYLSSNRQRTGTFFGPLQCHFSLVITCYIIQMYCHTLLTEACDNTAYYQYLSDAF